MSPLEVAQSAVASMLRGDRASQNLGIEIRDVAARAITPGAPSGAPSGPPNGIPS